MCGKCCHGYGGTYVSPEDIKAISKYIGEDPAQFVEKYCAMSGGRPVLAQKENGYCVFFKELCTIHEVKPRMCRQWPYLEAILRDPLNWKILADCCPGCKGEVPYEKAAEVVKSMLGKNKQPG